MLRPARRRGRLPDHLLAGRRRPQGRGTAGHGTSSLGLLLSTLAGLLLQGPYGAGTGLERALQRALVRATLDSSLGHHVGGPRGAVAAGRRGVAAFMLPRLPAATLRRAAGLRGGLGAAHHARSPRAGPLYDHASTGVQAPWGMPADIVHLDAMALWIGGLAVLAGVALRGQQIAAARPPPRWPARCPGSRSIAFGCVAALVASGVYETWREVGAWRRAGRHGLRAARPRQGRRPAGPARARVPGQAVHPARPAAGRRARGERAHADGDRSRPGDGRLVIAGYGDAVAAAAAAAAGPAALPLAAACAPAGPPPPEGERCPRGSGPRLGARHAAAAPLRRGGAGRRAR